MYTRTNRQCIPLSFLFTNVHTFVGFFNHQNEKVAHQACMLYMYILYLSQQLRQSLASIAIICIVYVYSAEIANRQLIIVRYSMEFALQLFGVMLGTQGETTSQCKDRGYLQGGVQVGFGVGLCRFLNVSIPSDVSAFSCTDYQVKRLLTMLIFEVFVIGTGVQTLTLKE